MKKDKNIPADNSRNGDAPVYRFRLFVAGDEPNSRQARATLERLCADQLRGRAQIQVVDVFADYQAAVEYRVIVVPTLIIEAPPPTRIIVGSLTDAGPLLDALGLAQGESRA
ncbi:MAG: circadian clock protein KaiB [Verrucomicrobia bacterium]|nr:circadian clock protein KaiB [Verrucomicrobiota bacterium]